MNLKLEPLSYFDKWLCLKLILVCEELFDYSSFLSYATSSCRSSTVFQSAIPSTFVQSLTVFEVAFCSPNIKWVLRMHLGQVVKSTELKALIFLSIVWVRVPVHRGIYVFEPHPSLPCPSDGTSSGGSWCTRIGSVQKRTENA